MGAAYLMAKSGLAVASMSVMRPELVMKSIVSVVMAGLLGGMKVEADRDESSTYAVMLASDVPQRCKLLKKLWDSQEGNVVKGNTMHYLLHGYHHMNPMDAMRLVFPPEAAAVLSLLYLHHGKPSKSSSLNLKRSHLNHPFRIQNKGLGVTPSINIPRI
ncbi:hypothetical protein TB2_004436 [Malus domestica]